MFLFDQPDRYLGVRVAGNPETTPGSALPV
jgi:hypothetical protein